MWYILIACLTGHVISGVRGFSNGSPDYSCKDPSTFHTRKINDTHEGIIMPQQMSSSPFRMDVSAMTFSPGGRITVTLYSQNPRQLLRGYFIQAIQADIHIQDLRRRAFGRFENLTINDKPSLCQASGNIPTGGITHANNRDRQRIRVVWIAPEGYSPGNVQFLATGVYNYDTYWTDVRSPSIAPSGYQTNSESRIRGSLTPTAAWYRWLQYIRQQQLLQKNNNQEGGANDVASNRIPDKSVNQNGTSNQKQAHPANKIALKHHNKDKPIIHTDSAQKSNKRSSSAPRRTESPPLSVNDHSHPNHDHNIHHN